ncbi:MAG TPA: hypothetical protein VLI69_00445 [Gammaproteobacteria bacterium]|nr:hypothetical protein [Gammaproteobacteria bacterium]
MKLGSSKLFLRSYRLIFAFPANALVNFIKKNTGSDVYDFPEKFTPFKYLDLNKG